MTGSLAATPVFAARVESPRQLRHGSIALRSSQDIDGIAAAGAVVAAALHAAADAARAGIATSQIDALVRGVIADHGAQPAFLNYANPTGGAAFPAACCTSVNEEVVHGIPGARVLADNDLLSVDIGVCLNGWCADAALSLVVGNGDAARIALVECAGTVLARGISMMEPGRRWSDIAACMQRTALEAGHGLVDGYMGHGIGRAMHESPQVPCVVSAGLREERDFTLLPGMVLAVEPLLVLGAATTPDAYGCIDGVETDVLPDGWTVATRNGLPAVHVEHTVAVTRHGPRVLTAGIAKVHSSEGASSVDCSNFQACLAGGGRR